MKCCVISHTSEHYVLDVSLVLTSSRLNSSLGTVFLCGSIAVKELIQYFNSNQHVMSKYLLTVASSHVIKVFRIRCAHLDLNLRPPST